MSVCFWSPSVISTIFHLWCVISQRRAFGHLLKKPTEATEEQTLEGLYIKVRPSQDNGLMNRIEQMP